MKSFICGLILRSIPYVGWGEEEQKEYPTLFLLQWSFQCSQQLKMNWLMRGFPEQQATQFAIERCACVIDKFRENHTYEEVQKLGYDNTTRNAAIYTQDCLFVRSQI